MMSDRSRNSKRRRVTKACVYCHRSHLMCDAERPCGRCKKRNIPHLCRDEEEDMHTMYRKLVEDIKTFHQSVRVEKGKTPNLDPNAKLSTPGSVGSLEDTEPRKPRFLTYLEDFSTIADLRDTISGPDGWSGSQASDGDEPQLFHSFGNMVDDGAELTNVGGIMGLAGLDQTKLNALITAAEKGKITPGLEGLSSTVSALNERLQQGGNVREVLSASKLLRYYEGAFNLHEYFQSKLPPSQLERIERILSPIRDKFLETLLLLDYREMMAMTQAFERKVLSMRKYFATLAIPGMVLRRTGEVCLISDSLAEMLGYRREDMALTMHIHQMMPVDSLVDFIIKVAVPLLRQGGCDSVVYDMTLLRSDSTGLRTRASITINRGMHNLPLCMIALIFPLDNPIPTSIQPDLEVIPSTYTPPHRGMEQVLLDGLEPGSGITLEDVQKVMRF
eukprot:comp6407_c0_seq1/m.2207 comp6407_c0_seq1/g.2207  ORF comp6407_c0_seq1/g.2207 comp6407_c0_seq1/m.2207 type:complete len:446 (-) comp6407_c0_seq1:21-1358(-)